MKATGIVRRIDNLGRVVIPKEIRSVMRIASGAQMEIYTDDEGSVVFKKYSPMAELALIAQGYVAALSRVGKCIVAVCDRERVVAASGGAKKELAGAFIGDAAEAALRARKTDGFDAVRPVGESGLHIAALCPIVAKSEVVGGVLLLHSREKPLPAKTVEEKKPLLELTAGLLALQLED